MARILIVEDSPLITQMLQMVCEGAGHVTLTAASFAEARDVAVAEADAAAPLEVILTDLHLPDSPEGDLVAALLSLPGLAAARVVLISGRPQAELDALVASTDALAAISKDVGLAGLSERLPALLDDL